MSQRKSNGISKRNLLKSKKSRPHSTNGKKGSLVIVGTGIRTVGQLTMEAIAWLKEAERLLYVVSDPIAESVIQDLNPKAAESMSGLYKEGRPRIEAYDAMIDRILKCVRSGKMTVAAFYGHPGVFAYPSHASIRLARMEGFYARMLPAISAEDCLFADLSVDPGDGGCQSYEATDFLLHANLIDPCSQLILWQIGVIGDWTYKRDTYDTRVMPLLLRKLNRFYPLSHLVTIYEAAVLPGTEPVIARIPLYALPDYSLSASMTLYVPPVRPQHGDRQMIKLFAKANKKIPRSWIQDEQD